MMLAPSASTSPEFNGSTAFGRSGGWSSARLAVLIVALATVCAVPSHAQPSRETHDVPWFQAHPQILDETLRRCHTDARLNATWDCQNAEAAGTSRMGQPLPNTRSGQGKMPVDNSGLPEPDYNPRTNPFGYQALKGACAKRGPGTEMFLPYCYQLDRYPEGHSGGR